MAFYTNKKPRVSGVSNHLKQKARMRPTTIYSLSAELGANTIDPYELNCRVRNGNGCGLVGIIISLILASCKRTNFKRNLSIATGSFTVGNLLAGISGSSISSNVR